MRKILFILLLNYGFAGFGEITKEQERVMEETKQMTFLAQTYDLKIKPDWLKSFYVERI